MNYELSNDIAFMSADDGKANVVGHAFLDQLNAALDRAQADGAAAVILRGREGIFSGGFDLNEFKKGPEAGIAMVRKGIELLLRLYALPLPVVAACTGHAVAMGAFLLLACDTRIGARGNFKITLPETAIAMELPGTMIELTKARLSPRYVTRAAIQSEVFDPDHAVKAGFLDETADTEDFEDRVLSAATKLASLPRAEYAANKLGVRKDTLAAMRAEYEKSLSLYS